MSSLVPESSLDILTRRESEILGLVADGFSNQEIADTLFITIHTVKEHLKHVFAKLDVRRRTEAVVRARELGILGASEKSSPSSNLPAAILPLVGREQELSQLEALLSDPDIRLVTLHGIGGVGKTHLALTAGSRQQASFADGVFLISLASLDSPLFFAPALAEALNVKLSGRGNAMQELLGHLRDKHLLLIMDSFEHMLDCTSFIGAILSAASRVKVLVTSRERLGMFGEVVYKLHGVRYPAENMADNLPDYGAVQLFLHNARCINNHFEASAEDITLIARICRFVEGLPLGILLATSWLNVLPMGDILNEISEDVYALDHSGTQVEYQSLRYVFQRSWEMLSPEQQKVLMWLAVFRERFTRQAAEQVASATLSDLNVLVNKSLLQAEPDLGHYSLHELLRQDALTRLKQVGETNTARSAHFDYFREFVSTHADDFDDLDAVLNDIRAAFDWGLENGRIVETAEMVLEMETFGEGRGYFQEGLYWFAQILCTQASLPGPLHADVLYHAGLYAFQTGEVEQSRHYLTSGIDVSFHLDDQTLLAQTMRQLGYLEARSGNYAEAESIFLECLEICRALGHTEELASCLNGLGLVASSVCDFEKSVTYYEEVLKIARGNGKHLARILGDIGVVAMRQGDYQKADQYFRDGLPQARDDNDLVSECILLSNLGESLYQQKDYAQARHYGLDSLRLAHKIEFSVAVAHQLEMIANVEAAEHNARRAACLYGAAEALRKAYNYPIRPRDQAEYDAAVAIISEQLSPDDFNSSWMHGSAMPLTEVIDGIK